MAARVDNTFKNRHEHIPSSVQESMTRHVERSLPQHLKKYQEAGTYIPQHVEREFTRHAENSLPSHLKQYGHAYVQQNVVQPSLSRPGQTEPSTSSAPPAGQRQTFSASTQEGPRQTSTPPTGQSSGPAPSEYDFILNPETQTRTPFMLSPGNMKQKILIIGIGAILLIILAVVVNSFLSSSANAHNNKLLQLAKTQNEIIRVIDEASDNVANQELKNLSVNTKLSISSTKQQTVSSLTNRGKKIKEKDITAPNADNDKVLSEGVQNSRFDETYRKLLEQRLADYQKQLQSVFDSGNSAEKEFTVSANSQINMLLAQKSPSSL